MRGDAELTDASVTETLGEAPATTDDQDVSPAGKRRRKRWWHVWYYRWGIRLAVLAFAVWYVTCVGFDSKFYFPDDKIYETPDEFGLAHESVRFRTSDGVQLAGWFLPAAQKPVRGTVIHFHGNAANISGHLTLVEWFPRQGYNLLMFDYRGYGDSEGSVTRAGTIIDGNAALDYALSRPDVKGGPIFFYGQSLGGAVATYGAASRPEVDAVVAAMTFGNYREIAAKHVERLIHVGWISRLLATMALSNGYNALDVVGQIAPRPLLVIVAGEDEICYPELGRELYDAAGEPKELWIAEGSGHLGIMLNHYDELISRVTDFYDRAAKQ